MTKIIDATGSIFDSGAEILVNPVNCVGVSGKGLALEFAKRFPTENDYYEIFCRNSELHIGKVLYFNIIDTDYYIAYFPTKITPSKPSKIEYIIDGLSALTTRLHQFRPKSIAIPALGCGLGGLEWADVKPLIVKAFENSGLDITVYIYPPQ